MKMIGICIARIRISIKKGVDISRSRREEGWPKNTTRGIFWVLH